MISTLKVRNTKNNPFPFVPNILATTEPLFGFYFRSFELYHVVKTLLCGLIWSETKTETFLSHASGTKASNTSERKPTGTNKIKFFLVDSFHFNSRFSQKNSIFSKKTFTITFSGKSLFHMKTFHFSDVCSEHIRFTSKPLHDSTFYKMGDEIFFNVWSPSRCCLSFYHILRSLPVYKFD